MNPHRKPTHGIVVLGAGAVGLATAMMLTRQGHEVSVVERDADPTPASPDEAWKSWDRPTINQFRQAHYLQAGARQLLDRQLPDVAKALTDAGATEFDVLTMMPATISDRTSRVGDDRFLALTARRPVIEYAVAKSAAQCVDVRRGSVVAGLLTRSATDSDLPRVSGVQLTTGEVIGADLVVDAMGRGSKLPGWLKKIGARPPSEFSEVGGFIYYTRYFRGDCLPSFPPDGLMSHVGSVTILTLPADAGTWSVTLVIASEDRALKGLREESVWTRVLAAYPDHAHWQDAETISGIVPSAGLNDRIRQFVVDGTPVVTGVLAVGDSWAHTDPTLGRGITLGLMHAAATTEVIDQHLGDPLALALAHDEITRNRLAPWHRNAVRTGKTRTLEVRAEISGVPLDRRDDSASMMNRAFSVAMKHDADMFRAYHEVASLQSTPQEVLSRPRLAERVLQVAAHHHEPQAAHPARDELLRLIATR